MKLFFTPSPGLSRWSRVAAAVLGGYLLASAWAVFCSVVLPGRAEAALAGMQLGFVVYVGAAIWAFSPVSLGRVWLGLLLPAAGLALSAALSSALSARLGG